MVSIEKNILVTNIQRLCFHDGPGIRTTFFLKGCLLRCPWCSNPENISFNKEKYSRHGIESQYGEFYSLDELYDISLKDYVYYTDGGGITYSGGEPLLQFTKLEPLLKKLHAKGIHQCVETSLFCSQENLNIAIKYIDFFYVDIKILNESNCENLLGGTLDMYLKNINLLITSNKKIVFRIPLINGYTFTQKNLKLIKDFLDEYKCFPIELLKQHSLGNSKYKSLGKQPISLTELNDDDIIKFKTDLENIGIENIKIRIV